MKKALSILLALAMLFAVTACSNNQQGELPKDDQKQATGTTQDEQKPAGDEAKDPAAQTVAQYYNTYMVADPTSMDISLNADTYSGTVINNVMEGLVRLEEKDGEYHMAPGDAQTWELSADGTVWTFHLGNNKWADGQEVTAQDYVYSLRRSADPATGCPNEFFLTPVKGYKEIKDGASIEELGVKALDDKTLEITLAYPMASFLEMCSGTIYYPQRQDMMEKYGEKYGTEAEYTMGNGPYMMESWVHNSKIVLKKNPYYWNAENVSLETVNLSILSDSTTIYNGFESYELDYCSTSEAEWIDKFMSYSDVVYQITPSATLAYSFYNTKDAIFSNANIRKAFTLAMDREELNDMCFGGANVPTYGWICPAISVGETNFREYAGQTIQEMTDEMTKEGLTAKDYLLKGMEELGLGNDPATLKVAFSLAGTDEWFRTFGEYLQQSYKATLGVNMEISFNNWDIFYDNVQKGNFQIGYMAWGAYYNDPYDMLSLFNSANDSIQTGWANAEFDQLVEAALSEQDETKRLEMYKKAEDILLRQDCAVCPVLTFTNNSFYRSYVKGYGELAFSITGYKGLSTGERPQ